MKFKLFRFLFLPLLFTGGAALRAADASGHWEGAINTPNPIVIRVDLSRGADQSWQGSIDIPVQGFRGFKLINVNNAGLQVTFALPTIPGNPQFSGTLSDDGKRISGDYTQGDATVPFSLDRKTPPPAAVDEAPMVAIPGKDLEGTWRGALSPMAGIQLRLALEVTSANAEKPVAVLVSLDQGEVRLPVTILTEQDSAVHFETPSVQGKFDGKLNADGSEMSGTWIQRGRPIPLVLKRTGKAPEKK